MPVRLPGIRHDPPVSEQKPAAAALAATRAPVPPLAAQMDMHPCECVWTCNLAPSEEDQAACSSNGTSSMRASPAATDVHCEVVWIQHRSIHGVDVVHACCKFVKPRLTT